MTQFETVIKAYLDERAARDPQFAAKYANEKKSIEECCKFIEAEVCDLVANKSGAQSYGMTDAEVYSLAVHYYDEADLKPKPIKACSTEVFKTGITYEPTEQEKEEARKAALKRLEDEAFEKLHTPKKTKPAATEQPAAEAQMSLFG